MATEIKLARGMKFGREVMLQRPHFAAAMMNVITLWSEIEYRWAVVLAEILEAEASAGVAMFNAVDNTGAKARLLKAAAEKRLPPQHQAQLKKLMTESIQFRLRNHIAHGQWGIDEHDPDCLILGDGRWASTALAGLHARTHGVETLLGSNPSLPKVYRYTLEDFSLEAEKLTGFVERQIDLTTAFKTYRRVLRDLVVQTTLEELRRPD